MMQRPMCSLPLSPAVKVKLVSAGFQFTADLIHLNPDQLSGEAGLSREEAEDVLQAAGTGGPLSASVSALELLQKEEETRSIVTFCSLLDSVLGGGLPVGRTAEICGVPGVGKTQLCLQLAVDVQVPACFGGVGGQVIYIDTEGSFLLQRVVDVATAAVRHCSLLVEDDDQRAAMMTFTVEIILSNIFLVRSRDYVELLAELHLLPDFLSDHPGVRLLVIDSVAFPFRQIDNLSQRTRLLHSLAQQLAAMANTHNVAVVTTNHMTTRLRGGLSQLVPALGESWGHASSLRLLLQWSGSQRLATILKSPGHVETSVPYQINSDGFRDADQSEQPPSKRARTLPDQSAASQSDACC
uniref:DNA repair protein RAD51 homolog 3 n=1 Tax=Echeneis naucrates TaxID=173247 RepID=A0A665U2J2_ECHNA